MARFLPGWAMVSAESGRLLENPDELAVDLASVRHEGNGVYAITTQADERLRLIKRVGPLDPDASFEYSVDLDAGPTIDLTLSEHLPTDDIAPTLAKILAESTAVARAESMLAVRAESAALVRGEPTAAVRGVPDDRVFGPGGTPDVDAVLRPVDAGLRAELRQRGLSAADPVRRTAAHKEIRQLALTMGVADGQPNAELLRTLLTEDERAILDRAKDGSRPLEERVDQRGYLAKAIGSSGVSSVVIGTAAAAFTGNPLVGVGIAVPTMVNAAVGSFAERHLDRQKATGRKPAYNADRKQREYDHPGPGGLLDGPERVRPPAEKMPRATAWRNYLGRHALPTLATAAVAGALTPFGVPALSTAMVIASSALAKSLAERLVDKKKLEFRLRRIDATERLRLSDPTLYLNQLTTEIANLQSRFNRLSTTPAPQPPTTTTPSTPPTAPSPPTSATPTPPDPPAPPPTVAPLPAGSPPTVMPGAAPSPAEAPGTSAGVVPAAAEVPGSPPFTVSLAAQLIENVSGAARRVFVGGRPAVDADPTEVARHVSAQMEGLLNAVGPGLLGAVTGAMGDKYFLNRDEAGRDASKQWSRTHQEAAQAAALAGLLEPRLREFRELADRLESSAGVPPDLSARAADRGLPVVTARPTGPRPSARAPWSTYAVQVAAGSLGGVAGAVGLDLVFDLPDLAVVLTAAGATGSMAATPVARSLFRRRELKVHEGLETNKAVRSVNQSELLEQRAITRYLLTQLSMQADSIARRTSPPRLVETLSETSPYYTDYVRAAVRQAELDNVPSGQPEHPFDRDARTERVQALQRIDHWAAELDRLESLSAPTEPATTARERLRFAIDRYESIANSNGTRRPFPDLATVDPADGQRVTGGVPDQVRSGVHQAVRRLVAEPSGKPLLAERLITLERLSRAADAIDHHATHGTDDSRAYVQQQFDQSLSDANRLWRESDVPNGLVLPVLVADPPPERTAPNEQNNLRHLVNWALDNARTTASDTRTPEAPAANRRTEGGRANDGPRAAER